MEIYGSTHLHGPQAINSPHSSEVSKPGPVDRGGPIRDELEISDAARAAEIQPASDAAPIRQDKVNAIRAQIAEGIYETPEKLDAAMDRLLDEIG